MSGQSRVGQVEVVLDLAIDLIGDLAGGAEARDLAPLSFERVGLQLVVDRDFRRFAGVMLFAVDVTEQVCDAILVLADDPAFDFPVFGRIERRFEFAHSPNAGAQSLNAHFYLALLDVFVGVDAQPLQKRTERQTLKYQRREDHAEGDEDDLVAEWKTERQRERGGERDDSTHPRPRDDEDVIHPRHSLALARPPR